MLELAEQRRQQQLANLESLVDLITQLDQLEDTMRLVGESCERGTPRRPHNGDMVAQPPELVFHQLAVLLAEPVLVTVEEVSEFDVVETSVIPL